MDETSDSSISDKSSPPQDEQHEPQDETKQPQDQEQTEPQNESQTEQPESNNQQKETQQPQQAEPQAVPEEQPSDGKPPEQPPQEKQPENPEPEPKPHRNTRRKIILIVAIVTILIMSTFAYFSFTNGKQNFNLIQTIPASSTTATIITSTTTAQTFSTIITPVNDIPKSEGIPACNNTCLEFGYNQGICQISTATNFSCVSSNYPNQTGRKYNLPPIRDWCAWLSVGITSDRAVGCCCYN